MEQLTQKLRSGEVKVQEVPPPLVAGGMVLVRNHYSLISAGTEGATAVSARKGLLGKAMERPQQVKQVIDVFRKQGPLQAYRAVMKKLEAYSPVGYSSAGVVIEVGEGVREFAVGDRVACAGVGYAGHAEIVAVPVNLCVKLPADADLKLAAYNTLGAIAMQGVRQADLRLGESCAVIGLGLIGQLTCLLLRAAGVRTVGIDVSAAAVKTAAGHCTDLALTRDESGCAEKIFAFSGGNGVDAVIITAGTDSLDPVNFAGEIARKKGRVVVVGAVPTGFERNPYYYPKELDLRMSCSYGPGRYDLDYEEKGIDYPVGYVRWTEKRNMESFQQLIHSGKIAVGYLTTHEFAFADSPQAYEMIVAKTEPFLGIVLRYDPAKAVESLKITVTPKATSGTVNIAFIGAGSYAQGNLLPNLPFKDKAVTRTGILTNTGTTSKRVAERFGFEFCTADEKDILGSDAVNTIFVATRHDSHAAYVVKALDAGKNVFVEKPLALNEAELKAVRDAVVRNGRTQLMVGFNRRFAPFANLLKEKISDGPMAMLYRVNAGAIPSGKWIQDEDFGGGRIIGEVCHFIDFLTFMCGAPPVRVYAAAMTTPENLNDIVSINLNFADGSTGVIGYFANGSKELPKEYFEVYCAGVTGIIRDFKTLEIYGKGRPFRKKSFCQEKGQPEMVREFIAAVKDGDSAPISFAELEAVTRATFKAMESLKTKQAVAIE